MGYGPRMRWGLRTEAPPPQCTFLEAKTAPSGARGDQNFTLHFEGFFPWRLWREPRLEHRGERALWISPSCQVATVTILSNPWVTHKGLTREARALMKPWFIPTPATGHKGHQRLWPPAVGQRSCLDTRAQHGTPCSSRSRRAKGFFQALAQLLWGQLSPLSWDFSFFICETETIIVSSSKVWELKGKQAADMGSILGSGRPPGEGNSNALQYSCLENPMDRGGWRGPWGCKELNMT